MDDDMKTEYLYSLWTSEWDRRAREYHSSTETSSGTQGQEDGAVPLLAVGESERVHYGSTSKHEEAKEQRRGRGRSVRGSEGVNRLR